MKTNLLLFVLMLSASSAFAAEIVGPQQVCSGSPVVYYAQPSSGESNYQFSVSGGTIVSYGTTSQGYPSISVNWSSSYSTGTVYLTYYTWAYPSFRNMSVYINPPAVTPTITGTTSLCQEALSGQVYNTDVGKFNYVWSILPSNAGSIVSGQGTSRATINWVSSGNLSVSFRTTSCGATTSSSRSINVYSRVTPSIVGQTEYCWPSGNFVYTTESGKVNYQWSLVQGIKISGGGPNDNTITVSWQGQHIAGVAMNVTVRYNDPVNGGCLSNYGQIAVSAKNPPTPGISGPSTVVAPLTTQYTASTFSYPVTDGWNWSVSSEINNISNSNASSTLTTTFYTTGSYEISVSRTINGCESVRAYRQINVTSGICCGGGGGGGGIEQLRSSGFTDEVNSFDAWPNPANEVITFSIPSSVPNGAKINLIDTNGKQVYVGSKVNDEVTKSVSSIYYGEGLYLLKMDSPSGMLVKKILVRH
jgi:Secretion system C-terminal sorting domain